MRRAPNKEMSSLRGKNLLAAMMKDIKPIRFWLLVATLFSIASLVVGMFSPYLTGEIVNIFDRYVETGIFEQAFFGHLLILLVLTFVGYAVFSAINTLLMNNIVSRFFTCKLRIKMSDKLKRLPISYVDTTKKGELIEKMTDDVGMIGHSIHQFINLFVSGALQLGLLIGMMFLVDYRMALLVVATIPISVGGSVIMMLAMSKSFENFRTEAGHLYATIEESYGGIRTIRTYGMQDVLKAKHSQTNDKMADYCVKGFRLAYLTEPMVALINKFCFVAICLLGGWLAITSSFAVGGVVAIVLYAAKIGSPLEAIARSMSSVQNVRAAASRVYGMLELPEIEEKGADVKLEGQSVVFEDITFGYTPDQTLFENLNINVTQGQKTAIVGPTGGGKTTIVNLLMRFYDPSKGAIIIDGHNILELPRHTVRDSFAMVLQDTWLFGGTIADNIAYGCKTATREQIIEACKSAYCDGFIEHLPDGYDTVISESADNISGGQKQLLTIARAFIADRPMLILDEATSNVDTRTEVLVQKAMDKLMQNRTCFVIAHRLSTIINADNILVIDNGKVVEQGTHTQLLQKQGFYYQMYNSQYNIG